jgi:hypothetical protein
MKNSIFIDIDTERKQPVIIGKPPEITPPTTPEEASVMINTDISCLCEALCTLIHMSDQSGYTNKEILVEASIKHLNNMLVEKENK